MNWWDRWTCNCTRAQQANTANTNCARMHAQTNNEECTITCQTNNECTITYFYISGIIYRDRRHGLEKPLDLQLISSFSYYYFSGATATPPDSSNRIPESQNHCCCRWTLDTSSTFWALCDCFLANASVFSLASLALCPDPRLKKKITPGVVELLARNLC